MTRAPPSPLSGWTLISLRPAGGHAPMRRAAAKHGARVLALSPWRLRRRDDPATRTALREALAAERVVFTSPAAVAAASALRKLRPGPGRIWFAIGEGTAAALRRAGVPPQRIRTPQRMDSDGLLALPDLQALRGTDVGLVTAPGGRGAIAPALAARGARVLRSDVYEREPVVWSAATSNKLRALTRPYAWVVSSGEALQRTRQALPPEWAQAWPDSLAVVASERLAVVAREAGFGRTLVAASARPADLVAALAQAAAERRFR
ncbi:uroporphyrinogen-III synthase [Luteimonas gilva]|uniref:Uroporphyrinogen-III synthase n=1 Tax=Luteimonas gilva TaxID=2572684 RepID=A0A4U5JM87_9GAMM|nr:uroporphyrinogen-III synthase [Luteimonas gilva]TKR30285.1 uroporphyrinogen-III synthase [Luteimonas gilva]